MNTDKSERKPLHPREPDRNAPYEPPRILSKRPVEHVTLVSGSGCVGPDCGIGGE